MISGTSMYRLMHHQVCTVAAHNLWAMWWKAIVSCFELWIYIYEFSASKTLWWWKRLKLFCDFELVQVVPAFHHSLVKVYVLSLCVCVLGLALHPCRLAGGCEWTCSLGTSLKDLQVPSLRLKKVFTFLTDQARVNSFILATLQSNAELVSKLLKAVLLCREWIWIHCNKKHSP